SRSLVLGMPRRPSRCTLFPYSTLFRSALTHKGNALGQFDIGQVQGGAGFEVAEVNFDVLGKVCGQAGDFELGQHVADDGLADLEDRKSTRLNSSHVKISYAVFCLKKKI